MDKLKITANGPLNGKITVSGAKNAALPLMYAGLLTADMSRLRNVPMLADVKIIQKLLQDMGARALTDNVHELEINGGTINNAYAPYGLVRTMRASILVLGLTLARFGEAQVNLPNGCAIGSHPVDQHLKGLETMGTEITIEHDYVKVKGRLKGTRVIVDIVAVGGAENLLMAATLAEGTIVLENCATGPEVVDLAECLAKVGARISDIGTPVTTVEKVEELHDCEHSVAPGRIEAGTFLCAVVMTGGGAVLCCVAPKTMEAVLGRLTKVDAVVEAGDDWISVDIKQRSKAVDIRTVVHPDFPTDMRAQFMAMNAIVKGSCRVVGTIFENHFMHVPELNRMGANVTTEGSTAYVKDVETPSDATVVTTDLWASASLVIAGLIAGGETIIEHIYHLDRGYEHTKKRLDHVGAKTERVSG